MNRKDSNAEWKDEGTWKKYKTYDMKVDPTQGDKATHIKLCSFKRPHMRAFHLAWMGFFTAFFVWFAIAPLLSEIKDTLGLTKKQIWSSNIASVTGTVVMRFILGPLCDKYGARIPFACVLAFASIPTAMIGLVQNAWSLCVLRLLIGVAGGTFVMCQYWTVSMFANEVAGTANALAGGWGNLGGGVTLLFMGSVLFPLFKMMFGDNAETAWRTVGVVPALMCLGIAFAIYKFGDDSPKGQYKELEAHGVKRKAAGSSFKQGASQYNTWLLFFQYGCCFGVELTMNNAAPLYFKEEFGLTTESAAAIGSIFGWMNLFARGIGGYTSDKLNVKHGLRGRILAQTIFLFVEGCLVLIFCRQGTLAGSIVCLVVFSLFVQAAEGSTYGIIPYVDPEATGSILGIAGAGGNTGAVLFSMLFRELDYKLAFTIMGCTIIFSAVTCFGLNLKGYGGLLFGYSKDSKAKKQCTGGFELQCAKCGHTLIEAGMMTGIRIADMRPTNDPSLQTMQPIGAPRTQTCAGGGRAMSTTGSSAGAGSVIRMDPSAPSSVVGLAELTIHESPTSDSLTQTRDV